MTIYMRKYPDFGGMTSVLILAYEDTGLLSGCLLDYAASGKLTGIHPHERISAMELERSWTIMLGAADVKTWPCPNCSKLLYDSVDHGIIHVHQADQCGA